MISSPFFIKRRPRGFFAFTTRVENITKKQLINTTFLLLYFYRNRYLHIQIFFPTAVSNIKQQTSNSCYDIGINTVQNNSINKIRKRGKKQIRTRDVF